MKTDPKQFLEQMMAHQGIVHKVCRLYCTDPGDRRDLFQEILLQLWRAWPRFRGEAKISTWMYRIALNTAISDLRKRKRRPELEQMPEGELKIGMNDPSLEDREKSTFLYNAINQLSKVEKAIVMLYLESHSYEEIAEIVGITPNHVGVKLSRIKQKLKQLLSPHLL